MRPDNPSFEVIPPGATVAPVVLDSTGQVLKVGDFVLLSCERAIIRDIDRYDIKRRLMVVVHVSAAHGVVGVCGRDAHDGIYRSEIPGIALHKMELSSLER